MQNNEPTCFALLAYLLIDLW